MEALIPVMTKLQEVISTVGYDDIKLPQIVVLGSQSSGKSSVLESLVGRSFLPRGVGIVTRCPLVLQMIHCPMDDTRNRSAKDNTLEHAEFARFLHSQELFTDFDEVRAEIEAETFRRAGNNKGVCSDPIGLKVYSPTVVNLTLVDLPGLTKVPVGDQPEDIDTMIEALAMQYISNPKAIILAVVAANVDMSTAESLKLARSVDSEGRRTLAVVTKLDLMDAGTDAYDVLSGRVIPVELGIIGVVNRSQQDINDNRTVADSLKAENLFMQRKYPLLASRSGSKYLGKTLSRLLLLHIRDCLPELKSRLNTMTVELQSLLDSFGQDISDKPRTLLNIVHKFADAYCQTIDGTALHIDTNELCGGARICYIFHETYNSFLESVDPLAELTLSEILTAMRNSTGPKPALFVPEVSFELLVKRQIKKLEYPSIRCVELVHDEMQRIVQNCGSDVLHELLRFPKLYERVVEVVKELLRSRLPITNAMVENLVNIELAYINTRHPDFDRETVLMERRTRKMSTDHVTSNRIAGDLLSSKPGGADINSTPGSAPQDKEAPASDGSRSWIPWGSKAPPSKSSDSNGHEISMRESTGTRSASTPQKPLNLLPEPCTAPSLKMSANEKRDCDVIKRLIFSYFRIVRRSIQDTVPKAIIYFLVNYVKENLQSELVSQLYSTDAMQELLSESTDIAQRRKETLALLEAAQKAAAIINEVRETQVW